MTDDSYINEVRKGLKESVVFFASQDKFVRESWVVAEFLTNLSISFQSADLLRGGDPPDVVFREAKFEVKEILDTDRRRHAEYKLALARANAATDPAELLQGYSPKDISITEVFALVHSVAQDFATRRYPPAVRKELDLLCYVNLQDVMGLTELPFPDVAPLAEFGYRSVSFLDGHRSCILCAAPNAPSFLHVQPGVIHRAVI